MRKQAEEYREGQKAVLPGVPVVIDNSQDYKSTMIKFLPWEKGIITYLSTS